jgi:hypothetical protein
MTKIFKTLAVAMICTSACALFSFQNDSKKGLARVNKLEGVELYFMSEPTRKYVKVNESDGLLGNVSVKALGSGGLSTPTIEEKAQRLVKNTVTMASKDGKQVDAVIYSGGKYLIGIKFVEAPTPQNDGIARVKKINGIDAYVFSEPLAPYEKISEGKAKKRNSSSLITAGLVNSAIDEDLTKLVKSAMDDDINTTEFGVVYTTGKTGIGIKYQQ